MVNIVEAFNHPVEAGQHQSFQLINYKCGPHVTIRPPCRFILVYGMGSMQRTFLHSNCHTDSTEQEVECTLSDTLVFVSGASEVPPLGLEKQPRIEFLHDPNSLHFSYGTHM